MCKCSKRRHSVDFIVDLAAETGIAIATAGSVACHAQAATRLVLEKQQHHCPVHCVRGWESGTRCATHAGHHHHEVAQGSASSETAHHAWEAVSETVISAIDRL